MSLQKTIARRRVNRAHRVRKAVRGTEARPRVTVHRTNLHLYVQVIDDLAGRTLCAASTKSLELPYGGNVKAAKAVGEAVASQVREKGLTQLCFDRGAYRYHGRVKAVAEALRAAGLQL
ncbi:MAG: 50S ribosomal protein L18 [Planctomycetia bacterium]